MVFFVSSRGVTYGPFKRNVSVLFGASSIQFLFGDCSPGFQKVFLPRASGKRLSAAAFEVQTFLKLAESRMKLPWRDMQMAYDCSRTLDRMG